MPEDNMLKAAQAEVLRLEAELAKTELGQKLALAREIVTLYRRSTDKPLHNITRLPENPTVARLVHEMTTTKTHKIETVCAEFLRIRSKRATSGELTPVVLGAGISLPGANPTKTLSAYLSTSELFDNDREKGGYGLVEWSQRVREDETATS
jgi:hypothetical protein